MNAAPAVPAIVPVPRCAVSVRAAVAGDYAFVDRLQDMQSKALGFMRKAALEGKIAAGEVLIAEETAGLGLRLGLGLGQQDNHHLNPNPNLNRSSPAPFGYCISSYRYLKRDELGVVYQMNVAPGAQRKLVGATLLRAVFERAPYGCKLLCCWCAQDLDANYFWESLGFIPLAFRTGASGRSARGQLRTHIFWQRRIREGDVTTPYWFPAKTDGGMMREDRLVLPIPPGVHWKSEMPILLPTAGVPEVQNLLPSAGVPEPGKKERSTGTLKPIAVKSRRVQFGSPDSEPVPVPVVEKDKSAKPKREKVKADPKHVAAARELRDRYLEQFNSGLVLPQGKYAVGRELTESPSATPRILLPAA